MRQMFKNTLGALMSLSLLAVPTVAMAADPLTLVLQPGVAFPMTHPQTDHFDPAGGSLYLKPMIGLTSYLDVGPSASVLVLPSKVPGVDPGVAWGLGGTLRVKRPRDNSNTGHGWSAASPWVDGDAQYIHTGSLNRGALSLAAGVSFPTSNARNLWLGPFVRYQDIIDGSRVGFDTTDAHVAIVGLSIEIGSTRKLVVVSDRDHDGVPDAEDRCPDVPGPKENQGCPWPKPAVVEKPKSVVVSPPVTVTETLTLNEKIQFAWDSSKLRPSENTQLANVLDKLSKFPKAHVKIEGHASSEGQVQHNNKLSLKRAETVLEYLVSKGVSRDRLTAVGLGSTVPIASNATEAGRVLNRRVDFVVTIVIVNGEAQ